MLVPGVLLVLALVLLLVESIVVRRSVAGFDARVHVNGTRGKSSVTRYVAAGLRASGRRTWGKITGVAPTIIDHEGLSVPIKRRGGPRVQEQFTIMSRAARSGVRNLVLECMSIQPELQRLEGRHFRPHVYVLTNVRDDHREALGADPDAQAEALCQAVPAGALILTRRGHHLPILAKYALKGGSVVKVVDDLTETESALVPRDAHADNVALAVAACAACGVPVEESLPAILAEASIASPAVAAEGSAGAVFVDGFAINDVPSAEESLVRWRRMYPRASRLAVIFNARADRPLRSAAFAKYLPTLHGLERIVLIGAHAPYMKRALVRAGFPNDRISSWSHRQAAAARDELLTLGLTSEYLIIGLGNIGGDGHLVRAALAGEVAHAV